MGWGCHPDTLSMASAHHQAKDVAGEAGTLEYLRAYRDAYQEEVSRNPLRGGSEYIARIDAVIQHWSVGGQPDFCEVLIPGMVGARSAAKTSN